MDSGCESYRRFREEGDQERWRRSSGSTAAAFLRSKTKNDPKNFGSDRIHLDSGAIFW